MTHQVSQIDDKPIVLVVLTDPFTGEESPQINAAVAALMEHLEPPVYRLMDFTDCSMDWGNMQVGFANQIKKIPGSMTDPNIIPVVVGVDHRGAQGAAIEGLGHERFGGLTIKMFDTRDEALAYIQTELDARAAE